MNNEILFEAIIDDNSKSYLKNIVRNCLDIEKNPYDFKDEFIKNSGFDFCPSRTQFFSGGSIEIEDSSIEANNLLKYCFNNKKDYLFAINTEFYNNEDYYKINSVNLAFKYKVSNYNLLSIRDDFFYGYSALLFPSDLSFFILLTIDYDIFVGKKDFIEVIFEKDLITAINNFEEHTSCYRSDNINKLTKKYKDIIYSKYYRI